MKIGRIAVVPAEIALIDRYGVMYEIAVVAARVIVCEKFRRQRLLLRDFSGDRAMVRKPHGLVVHPFIEVTLIR